MFIDADHINMCKFPNYMDERYVELRKVLQALSRNAVPAQEENFARAHMLPMGTANARELFEPE